MMYVSYYFILLMDCPFIIWHFLLIFNKEIHIQTPFCPIIQHGRTEYRFSDSGARLFSQSFSIHLRYVPFCHNTCRHRHSLYSWPLQKHHHKQKPPFHDGKVVSLLLMWHSVCNRCTLIFFNRLHNVLKDLCCSII